MRVSGLAGFRQAGARDRTGEGLDEGVLEDREGVDLADGEMDGERGGRNEPAAVVNGCYGSVAIQETHGFVMPSQVLQLSRMWVRESVWGGT